MTALYHYRRLHCILFPGEQAEDPAFGFTVLILIALPLAISGLLTGGHAAEVAESLATVARAAAATAESVARGAMAAATVAGLASLVPTAAAETVRNAAAVRVSIRLR